MCVVDQSTELKEHHRKQRIVITTVGSLGDLHPYIAIARGLQTRGYEVVFATSKCYQNKIEQLGMEFRAIHPNSDWVNDPEVMRRRSNLRMGFIRVGREWLIPELRESYEEILAATEGADLLVSMLANYSARLVAEKTDIPWASVVHIPLGFFSTYDVPIIPLAPVLSKKLRCLGPGFWKPLFWLGKRASRFMVKPWYRLRADIGLPPTKEGNPLVDSHSPQLVLAPFSKLLADKQPDWPLQTIITGFPFFDTNGDSKLPKSLARFLEDGPPPIIFTLGSAVSMNAGAFYEHSATAAKLLEYRAVLILGKNAKKLPVSLPHGIIAVDYAPFSELFPRAAAIVHHGGIGTTGLAMRSGRPMLVIPHAWDQPDNAERATRLGIARTISQHRYTPNRAMTELRCLLENPEYTQRARKVQEQLKNEDGVKKACDALEQLLHNSKIAEPFVK